MNLDLIMNFLEKGHSILVWGAAVGVPIMGYLKWRDGNQRFSQGRTKRLFDLMKKKRDWRAIPSGALQLAVKDAFGINLSGDEIRFVFERDNAIEMFRTIGRAGRFVKFNPIESNYKDNRPAAWRKYTFKRTFQTLLLSSIIFYFITTFALPQLKIFNSVVTGILILVSAIITFILMYVSMAAESAGHLLNVDESYPLPAYGHVPEAQLPAATKTRKPRTKKSAEADETPKTATVGQIAHSDASSRTIRIERELLSNSQ
ncbi:hypothetical protein [Burkholderia sp. RF4-BP95]|uniref:hypothetical protein n=1 Tax=Burkholderia sp. RF4-BP95 TaxID=1637845 RepID=UPI0012E3A326|nr:hypothetical protein [Burkholderia sp. RF4-BP95]